MLAEALCALRRHEFDVKAAAQTLGCSTSQLLKFVALSPAARGELDRSRTARGLPRLRR